ncbi:hypothetical protein D7W82_16750 [Corallococcus sp. CA049B]|nr:hypothetical protein D7W82_16750 [Corallococcus sp. CA049B]
MTAARCPRPTRRGPGPSSFPARSCRRAGARSPPSRSRTRKSWVRVTGDWKRGAAEHHDSKG